MSRMTPLVREFMQHGRVPDCPVIDMHTHPDRFSGIHFPHADVDGILRTMDRGGVTIIAMALHAAMGDPRYGHPIMLEMLRAHPDRFRGYWYYNPRYPELLEEARAAALQTPGIIGYKIHPGWSNVPLNDEAHHPLFAWAHEHRLLLLSHTWHDPLCGVPACRWVAEHYPDIRFLLGHSCYGDWDGAIELARTFPNVYLELTAAEFAPGFIDRACREAGAHKIIFGTDLPWFDPFAGIGCVLFADITDEDRHAILHGNAERLLAEQAERQVSTVI